MSVQDRLARLLFIVPYVVSRDGVPLAELASKLGVTAAQIVSDLDLLALVGRPPLTPDHLIDLYVEDDVVYVELDQSLSRPLRLTHEEASALVLGASLVGDLGGLGDELHALIETLLAHLTVSEQQTVRTLAARVRIADGESTAPSVAATLRQAAEEHERVRLDYYSASSDQQKRYLLEPLALLSHSGVGYLLALDLDAERREKLFRLDRIGEARTTGERFEPPADLDLERFRTPKLFFGNDAPGAEVRFSPAVAALVRERFAGESITTEADGSVRVHLASSSPAFLARWVLPFGLDAEVVGPESARHYLAELCDAAARRYDATI